MTYSSVLAISPVVTTYHTILRDQNGRGCMLSIDYGEGGAKRIEHVQALADTIAAYVGHQGLKGLMHFIHLLCRDSAVITGVPVQILVYDMSLKI